MKKNFNLNMDYNLKSHIIGKVWIFMAMVVFFSVPTTICLYYDVKPDLSIIGSWAVIVPFLINILSGIVEPLIYAPMLGTNSAYIAFITGNLSNLKIPCVVKAQEICGTKVGTEENEVVATLSVATSTLVTTVIIGIFVLILGVSNLQSVLTAEENAWIMPAFTCVVYALFGSLGGKYIVKNFKLALFPLIIVVVLSIILGVCKLEVGSAYLFVGIAICAVFAVLQVMREMKKKKIEEEKEHLATIASSDVEIETVGDNTQTDEMQDENCQNVACDTQDTPQTSDEE